MLVRGGFLHPVPRGAAGLDDLEHGTLAVLGGGTGQQRANGGDGPAALADHLADVALVQPQFENDNAFAVDFRDLNFIGIIDQCPDHVLDKRFHVVPTPG